MTREEAKKILEAGGTLHYHVWTWSATYMACSEGCCDDGFPNVESTLDYIESITNGDWNYLQKGTE